MNYKTALITILLPISLLLSIDSFAQSTETIRSGRPGQSIGPYSVGQGYLQVQTGFLLSRSESLSSETDVQDINTVIRYGFSERLEFSSLIVYQRDQLSGSEDSVGLSRLDLGFRLNINSKPKGLIPAIGFQTRLSLDTVSQEFRSDNITPVMLLVTHHQLSPYVLWIHNFGLNYGQEDLDPNYLWISNLSFSLTDKWGAFVELYGTKVNGSSSYFYDFGLSYLVTKDFQLDAFAGSDMTSGLNEQFVSVGVSWRSKVN